MKKIPAWISESIGSITYLIGAVFAFCAYQKSSLAHGSMAAVSDFLSSALLVISIGVSATKIRVAVYMRRLHLRKIENERLAKEIATQETNLDS